MIDGIEQGGFMEQTSRRLGSGQEIICIATDQSRQGNQRLIIGTRDKMVLVIDIDARGQLVPVLSVQLDKTVPKGVAFAENAEDIYVFGLFEGNM